MRTLPHEELAGYVCSAMDQVFRTMLNSEAEPDTPYFDNREPPSIDGVVALVGIAGAWTGTGRLICSPHVACILASNLLTATFESVDEEVLDAIAEISNMVVGNIKTMLEEQLGPL